MKLFDSWTFRATVMGTFRDKFRFRLKKLILKFSQVIDEDWVVLFVHEYVDGNTAQGVLKFSFCMLLSLKCEKYCAR